MSHVVLAGEQGIAILENSNFTNRELEEIFALYPELIYLPIAAHSSSSSDSDSSDLTLKLYTEATNEVYTIEKKSEQVHVSKNYVPFQVMTKNLQGEIAGSLYETLKADSGSERISRQIAEAFSEEFNSTKGLRVQAAYSVDILAYYDDDQFIKYGDVLKVRLVVGKAISEKVLIQDLQTLSWSLKTRELEKEEKPFYSPVKISRVSSLFNLARRHPVKRTIQPHNGIDYVAKSGTPVYPALDGVITVIGRTRAKGKFIIIEHDNGYQTTYDHLRMFKKGLRVGDRVNLDDQIGEVGRTGYATGPHLHFGVMKDGFYVDPLFLVKEYTYDQRDLFEAFDISFEENLANETETEIE